MQGCPCPCLSKRRAPKPFVSACAMAVPRAQACETGGGSEGRVRLRGGETTHSLGVHEPLCSLLESGPRRASERSSPSPPPQPERAAESCQSGPAGSGSVTICASAGSDPVTAESAAHTQPRPRGEQNPSPVQGEAAGGATLLEATCQHHCLGPPLPPLGTGWEKGRPAAGLLGTVAP